MLIFSLGEACTRADMSVNDPFTIKGNHITIPQD